MIGLESAISTKTKADVPLFGNLKQEYIKNDKSELVVGECSQVTVMTRLHRPVSNKIVYEHE